MVELLSFNLAHHLQLWLVLHPLEFPPLLEPWPFVLLIFQVEHLIDRQPSELWKWLIANLR